MIISKEEIIAEMQSLINNIPDKYYADLLYDSMSLLTIKRSNSGTNTNIKPKMRGFVFRIFNGKKYFEIAHPEIYHLKKQVERLLSRIEFFPDIELIKHPKHQFDKELAMQRDFTEISIADKVQQINGYFDSLKSSNDLVKNVFVYFQDSIQERIFYNTENSLLRQVLPRIGLQISAIVVTKGKIDSNKMTVSGQGGWEVLDQLSPERLESFAQTSIEIAQATRAPSGILPVICDPSVSGILAHAIFGHGVQGDTIVQDRSYWKQFFNKPVASEIVNISDALQSGVYGNYYFDDEGVLSQKTPMVEVGKLTHYLHSRLSATLLNMPDALRGNGRRQNFMHPIYPRNSNTFFEPGDQSLEEMISDIQYGLLVENGDYGMEEFDGSLQCNSKSGFLIENGEVTKRVSGITLSGQARDFLLSISGVSKGPIDFIGLNSRKGLDEWVPVTYGGVYIKADKAFVSPG
ncbi:MAG: TldD/PmbA family protein [Promethearchaeota archaeon]